jgi:zinc transport system substrate-binding protein
LVQEFHGDAPSQRAISDLIERIEENNVKLLYTEPQFNPTIVQRLTQETGIETKEIDPIGSELSPE